MLIEGRHSSTTPDWAGCPELESVPGKVSGAWVFRGTQRRSAFIASLTLVLLDENLPHKLRLLIPDHELRTVEFQGWKPLTNGALLSAAEGAGFEVMVTADQSTATNRICRNVK